MIDISVFFEDWSGTLLLWAIIYAGILVIYFGLGLFIEFISWMSPHRRIQVNREGSERIRDIRQSVVSMTTIAAYVTGGLYLQVKGWTLFTPWELTWWSVPLSFVISLIVYDAWFYWFHRLMHTKPFYWIHARHHVSVAPRPWSSNNDSLLGTFFEQFYFFVAPIFIPIPPLVLVAHKAWDQIISAFGHAGYEFFASPMTRSPWLGVSTTYHDQHHSHFKYNFANTFTFWDRIMGTLHPQYDLKVMEFENQSPQAGGQS